MSSENAGTTEHLSKPGDLRGSETYSENLDFWQRAWNMVKTPYTQMPNLSYIETMCEYLKEKGVEHVLDLGCGSGWLSVLLARQGFQMTGLDVADHAIELARLWAQQENLKIEFDVGDMSELNYPTGSFDAVLGNSIFEHLSLQLCEQALARIKDALIPGGVLIGIFDKVGGGPGEYYELGDGTHVYTDKGRKGMLLRHFSNEELASLLDDWKITKWDDLENGTRFICAHTKN